VEGCPPEVIFRPRQERGSVHQACHVIEVPRPGRVGHRHVQRHGGRVAGLGGKHTARSVCELELDQVHRGLVIIPASLRAEGGFGESLSTW
jgi:hypothetical protein